jgi:Methyltransferase FkbM domain
LNIPNRVGLAKIDTEGHELAVLHGMRKLIERDHPVLIVEANSADVVVFLEGLGYSVTQGQNSSNYVCRFGLETSKSKE